MSTPFEDYLNAKVGEVAGMPILRRHQMSIPRVNSARVDFQAGYEAAMKELMETEKEVKNA